MFAHGLAARVQHFGADAETATKPATELTASASDVSVATEILGATYAFGLAAAVLGLY